MSVPCNATNTSGSLVLRLEKFPAAFRPDEGISSSCFFRNSRSLCRGPPVWSKNFPWTSILFVRSDSRYVQGQRYGFPTIACRLGGCESGLQVLLSHCTLSFIYFPIVPLLPMNNHSRHCARQTMCSGQ
jgi:hypothetical protein